MFRRIPIVTTIAIALLSATVAKGLWDEPAAARIARLVEQLSADRLQQRTDAERQLQQMGPAALPHLPNPRTLDAGAAEAVRRVRLLLERQQAQASLQPGRVSISGTRSVAAIFQALAEQTGNPVDINALPAAIRERPITVDFNAVPFWQAVSSLEQQADLSGRVEGDSLVLRASSREPLEPLSTAVAVVGPFRLTLVSAAVRPDFTAPDRRLLRLTIEVETEPRLRPLFAHVADKDFAVTMTANDDDPLPPLSPNASREIPIDNGGPVRLTHDVILPPTDSAAQQPTFTLHGTFAVEVASGQEHFSFRHLDEPGSVTRRHGGVSVTLAEVDQAGDDLQATLRIAYDVDAPRFESHRAWVFHNDVQLTTGDGPPRLPADHETLHEAGSGVTLRYRFADVSLTDTTTLRYTAPTLITRVPVRFTIRDIPIEAQ